MGLRLLHPWFGLYPRKAEYKHNEAPARDADPSPRYENTTEYMGTRVDWFSDGSVSINGLRYYGGGDAA